jgi:hypothetical protein
LGRPGAVGRSAVSGWATALLALVLASTAAAAGLSPVASSLTVPGGALVDPAGRVWVSDHLQGFCRVTAAGAIENPHTPPVAGDPAPTCLGGLGLRTAAPGAAGQAVFLDPTPTSPGSGDELALIPDGAANGTGLVRARWNPATGLFDVQDEIPLATGGIANRATAVSLGPDGSLYIAFQRTTEVWRIVDPAAPAGAVVVQAVGRTAGPRPPSGIAAGLIGPLGAETPVVYLGEPTGITRLTPNPAAPPAATDIALVPAGTAVGPLVYDLARRQLYVGTAAGAADVVDRFNTLTATADTPLTTGFSGVSGLGLRPDGDLFVADDQGGADFVGRLFQLTLPKAHVVGGPVGVTNQLQPTFTVQGEPALQCALFPLSAAPVWTPCPSATFASAPLTNGLTYAFAVRSLQGALSGGPELRVFRVDTTPPPAPVAVPAATSTPRRSLSLRGMSKDGLISLARLRRIGLRLSVVLPKGTRTLRLSVVSGVPRRGVVFRAVRSPLRAGTLLVVLHSRKLLRALRPGRYTVRVRLGPSPAQLGPFITGGFRVIP